MERARVRPSLVPKVILIDTACNHEDFQQVLMSNSKLLESNNGSSAQSLHYMSDRDGYERLCPRGGCLMLDTKFFKVAAELAWKLLSTCLVSRQIEEGLQRLKINCRVTTGLTFVFEKSIASDRLTH